MGSTYRYISIFWYNILKRGDGIHGAARLELALIPACRNLLETAIAISIQQRHPITPGELPAAIGRQDVLASAIPVYVLCRGRG